MDEIKFEPNSFKYKAQQETKNIGANKYQKKNKVINGTATVKKKSEWIKMKDIIFAGDIAKIKEFAWQEVIVPSVKKAIHDIVTNGADILIYGADGNPNKKIDIVNSSKITYGSFFNQTTRPLNSIIEPFKRVYDYDTILYDTIKDAKDVANSMISTVEDYGFVKVSDYYDYSGVTGDPMSHNYGWSKSDLGNIAIAQHGNKYIIRLPKPSEIKR